MEPAHGYRAALVGLLIALFLTTAGCLSRESLLQRGNMAFQKGELGKAREFYQQALQHESTKTVASYNLGRVYFEQGEFEKAIESFEQARPEEVYQPMLPVYRARALAELGRKEEAERGFREAAAIHPELGESHLYLARFLAAQGDKEGAVAAIQPALRFPELQEQASLLAAGWLMEKNRPAEAAALLEELVKTHGDRYGTYLELGKAHLSSGQVRNAETALRRGLALNPGEVEGLYYLGVALQKQSRNDLATQLFQAVVEKDDGEWKEKARSSLSEGL